MQSRSVTVAVAIPLLILSGCGGKSSPVSVEGTTVSNTGSGKWTAEHPDAIQFELEQVYGVNEEPEVETLAQPAGVTIDSDENVYLIDGKDSRLVSFTKDGIFRWETGRKGNGPGEFENAWDVSADIDGLYVSNVSGSRVDHFSFDGEFLETTSMLGDTGGQSFVTLAGFTGPKRPVLAAGLINKFGVEITTLDAGADSAQSNTFEIDLSDAFDLPEGFIVTPDLFVSNGLVTSGHYTRYEHAYYDESGNLVRKVLRDFDKMVPPATKVSGRSATFQSFGKVGAPISVGDGMWMSVTNWPTNVADTGAYMDMSPESQPELVYAYMLDLFDDKGELLWSKQYDGESPLGGSIAMAHGDRLYVVASSPFPQVRRYRVVVNVAP